MALKVLLLEDQPLLAEALQRILRLLDDGVEIEPLRDLAGLRDRLDETPDALIVLSCARALDDPAENVSSIREAAPNAKIVVYRDCSDSAEVRELFVSGADAVIPDQSSSNIVSAALRLVVAGGKYLPPEVFGPAALGADLAVRRIEAAEYHLTPQQSKVLGLLAHGLSNRQIADRLAIAEGTVKLHVNAILKALDVPNRTTAALLARDLVDASATDLRKAG